MSRKKAPSRSEMDLSQQAAVLNQFDALHTGSSMLVENDDNPMLLYYQLLANRGNTFHWEYLERGQDCWRVKITKTAPQTPELSIGELAARDAQLAEIFEQLGIPYCCDGKKTVREYCAETGLADTKLQEQLQELLKQKNQPEHYDFRNWKAGLLAEYIHRTYHETIRSQTTRLYEQARALAAQSENNREQFGGLAEGLHHFFTYLRDHLEREEQVLYPLIHTLEAARKRKRRMVVPIVPPVKSRLSSLETEHFVLGQEIIRFKALGAAYARHGQQCTHCQQFFENLVAFEKDLIQHIHLENNILFPKVLIVEKELDQRRLFRT